MVENIKNKIETLYKGKDRETGISLAEILVYCMLFVVLTVIVVNVITTTIASSQRITSSSSTQAKMNQAASMLQRELSLATSINYASPTRADFTVRQENANMKVSVFSYIPGTTTTFPAGVTADKMPPYNAVMRVTYPEGSNTPNSVTALVQGYDPDTYSNELFAYFNKANEELVMGSTSNSTARGAIARIEFRLAAKADGRASALQIESSAVPMFSQPDTIAGEDNLPLVAECVPNFRSTIAPRTQGATVSWNAAPGAVSYTVTRVNTRTGATEGSLLISDPNVTSVPSNAAIVTGLAWGTTYEWRITVSSAGGVQTNCATTTATVVPEVVRIVNVNPHATNLTTTSPVTSLSLTYPTNGGETTRAETTENLLNGSRYTVARGLVNQLAWQSRYGATEYKLYVNGSSTPFVTVRNGNTFFQDTNTNHANYGNITSYRVSASNAGGEGFLSDPVELISPPAAPVLRQAGSDSALPGTDPVRPDGSVTLRGETYSPTSISTVNRIMLTGASANASGYRTYGYRGNTAAVTNCSTDALTYTQNLNFVSEGTVDDNALWGSYDCYAVAGQNAAGVGAMSTAVDIKQYPGPFNLNGGVSSAQYNFLALDHGHWGDARCWVDRRNIAASDHACFSDIASMRAFAGDPKPHGLFDKIADQYTHINISYGRSLNATGGYNITRSIDTNGVKCGTSAKSNLNGCPYQGTASYNGRYTNDANITVSFRYEMPGAAYSYRVAAASAAGMERPKTGNRVYTNPDIPSHGRTWYENKERERRIIASALTSTRLGNSSYIRVESGETPGQHDSRYTGFNHHTWWGNSSEVSNNNTSQWVCDGGVGWGNGCVSAPYTNPNPANHNARSYTARWDVGGSQVWSRTIWKNGYQVRADHSGNYSWTRYSESWPTYWTGGSAGYWSGYASRAGEVDYKAGIEVPPSGPLVSGEQGAAVCSTMRETDPDFTLECVNGTGIPSAPSNVRITNTAYNEATKVTTYTVTWDAVPGATDYKHTINSGAETSTTATSTLVTVANGQNHAFRIRTTNLNNDSSWSSALALPSLAVGSVTLATPTPTATNIPLSWNTVTGVTSYEVWRSINGGNATRVATVTTNSYNAAWTQASGQEQKFYIIGKNASASATSNTVRVVGTLNQPTLTLAKSGATISGTIGAVTGATDYVIQYRLGTGAWTAVATQTATTFTHTPPDAVAGTTYEYRVQAKNLNVSSTWRTATVTV